MHFDNDIYVEFDLLAMTSILHNIKHVKRDNSSIDKHPALCIRYVMHVFALFG